MKRWELNLFIKSIREAIDDFGLIKSGDRVLIGVSGGKDSSLLFLALNLLREYNIYDFEVTGIMINHGMLRGVEAYQKYVHTQGWSLVIHEEHFGDNLSLLNSISPCYTCSRLRKGIIKKYALENGYNKIAFGHTKDDLVETFMMNIIKHGKIASIPAILEDVDSGLQMIRPLVYLKETAIIKAVERYEMPLVSSTCTFAVERSRVLAERMVEKIEKDEPDFSSQVIKALGNIDLTRTLNRIHTQPFED